MESRVRHEPLDDSAREGVAGERPPVIGEVAPRHASVMGSILAPGRFVRKTVPEIVDVFVADAVDVALMVPV